MQAAPVKYTAQAFLKIVIRLIPKAVCMQSQSLMKFRYLNMLSTQCRQYRMMLVLLIW